VSGANSTSNTNASAPPRSAKVVRDGKAGDIMFSRVASGGICWLYDSCSAALISQRAGTPHPGLTRPMPPPRWLFRLEAGFLDHPLPARKVFLDVAAEPLGRATDRVHPLAG